jgi:hypothetical protein
MISATRCSRLMRLTPAVCVLVAMAVPLSSDQAAGDFAGPFTEIVAPAGSPAAQPNLVSDRSGRAWLSWLEAKPGGGHVFRAAALTGRTFAAPITIAEGTNFLANWADFPALFVAADGTMAAHWLERGTSRAAYGVRLKTSSNGGRTWSDAITPHRDNSAVEHGFVSFFSAPGGGAGLVWLDGRAMAGHTGPGHPAGDMALRATTIKGAQLGDEMLLDARVCDCCQTTATTTGDGTVVVAYRDKGVPAAGAIETRDISVVRFSGGTWSAPAPVHTDNWELGGCPVNGPSIAAAGQSVVVSWFTEAGRTARVLTAFSDDGGRTFSAPVRLDTMATLGRVDVVMPSATRAIVSFIERTADGARLVAREVRRDGGVGQPVVIASVSPERASGFARMTTAGGRLIVAWTDVQPKAPSRVRVASAELSPARR